MTVHYAKAPITEAVIDLRAEMPADFVNLVNEIADTIKDKFPIRHPLQTYEMRFQVNPGAPNFASNTAPAGLRLESSNRDRVLQLQRTGFTYSHMAPYSNWKGFRNEAVELWKVFREHTKVETVSRCAVRVINKIELPGSLGSLKNFSKLVPQLPRSSVLNSCFMQLQIPLPEIDGESAALVNMGARPVNDQNFEFVLDLDLFRLRETAANSDQMWSVLDALSKAKNDLFESFITDKLRERIS